MTRVDLILLHPPSIYKFRELPLFYGPVSDVIPSSSIFENYPIGFLTLSEYLNSRGIAVRIVNLAFTRLCGRRHPAFRSPEIIAKDIRNIARYTGAPVMVIGDLLQAGKDYAERFLLAMKKYRITNELEWPVKGWKLNLMSVFKLFFGRGGRGGQPGGERHGKGHSVHNYRGGTGDSGAARR